MSTRGFPARLLFLPGALGNSDFWEPLARELSDRPERVLMSYPGFSGEPAELSISCFEDLVDHVVAQIDRPTALIAQSMGGVLAIEATLRKRSLITHLVLIATSGGLDTAKLGAVDWRQNFRNDHPDVPEWFIAYKSDLTRQLRSIDVPVLLIWGDGDPLSPVTIAESLLSHFPQAKLHIVPGGEHDLARTHAQLIAPFIEAHLRPVSRSH